MDTYEFLLITVKVLWYFLWLFVCTEIVVYVLTALTPMWFDIRLIVLWLVIGSIIPMLFRK